MQKPVLLPKTLPSGQPSLPCFAWIAGTRIPSVASEEVRDASFLGGCALQPFVHPFRPKSQAPATADPHCAQPPSPDLGIDCLSPALRSTRGLVNPEPWRWHRRCCCDGGRRIRSSGTMLALLSVMSNQGFCERSHNGFKNVWRKHRHGSVHHGDSLGSRTSTSRPICHRNRLDCAG
jgi:hypothetical protein